MKKFKLITTILSTIILSILSTTAYAENKYRQIDPVGNIYYGLNESLTKNPIGNTDCLVYIDDISQVYSMGNIELLGDIDYSLLDTLYYINSDNKIATIHNVDYIEFTTSKGYTSGPGRGPSNKRYQVDGLSLKNSKGSDTNADPNESRYVSDDNYICSRYTKDDGTPYTGLYLSKNLTGTEKQWIVLDDNGFYKKIRDKNDYVSVTINGNICTDDLYTNGPNYGNFDPNAGYKYLGKKDTYQGYNIYYLVLNDWVYNNGQWYHSDNSGLLNERWQLINGKWYYFGDFDKRMFANKWVGSQYNWYYLGDDGAMVSNKYINGHWVNENGLCTDQYYYYY